MITIKKLTIIFLAIVMFFLPILMTYNQQQAHAMTSKVATQAAKKVVKEVVTDSAVQMAMDILFDYEMKQMMVDEFENPDDGYKAVCLEEKDSKCTKPAQAKIPNTKDEKKVLADKVEEVLEKKTGTHKGWAKFLDWFIPVFFIGGAIAWVTSLFDSETESLFDDIAKEALDETGFIKPLSELNKSDNDTIQGPNGKPLPKPEEIPFTPDTPITMPTKPIVFEVDFTNKPSTRYDIKLSGTVPFLSSMFMIDIDSNNPNDWVRTVRFGNETGYSFTLNSSYSLIDTGVYGTWYEGYTHKWSTARPNNILINGSVYNYPPGVSWSTFDLPNLFKPKRIAVNGMLAGADGYGIQGYILSDGNNTATFNGATEKIVNGSVKLNEISIENQNMVGYAMKARVSIFPDVDALGGLPSLPPYKPDLKPIDSFTIKNSIYNVGDSEYKIPAPYVVPIKTPDGTLVKPDGAGGWQDLQGNSINVDEDSLIVDDIQISDNGEILLPDGEIIQKPEAEIPPEKEEYPKCEKDLDKIEFKKVGTAFTYAFPFSIPWDVKRYIDAAFGGVGSERPSFALFGFFGDARIELPVYFDNWMPFLHGALVLMFDVSLIYLFYRFMGRGGD